jgi:hypothetical protein
MTKPLVEGRIRKGGRNICEPFDRPSPPGRFESKSDILREALTEMVNAHSSNNIGLGASQRRIAALARARKALES